MKYFLVKKKYPLDEKKIDDVLAFLAYQIYDDVGYIAWECTKTPGFGLLLKLLALPKKM